MQCCSFRIGDHPGFKVRAINLELEFIHVSNIEYGTDRGDG
jgi:hypothetical protein